MKNKIGKILIIGGIFLALFVVGRALYFSPNDDSGLSLADALRGASPTASAATASHEQQPSRLIIPSLEIDAEVQPVGVTKTGNMAAPNNFTDVSWYKYGTVPGKIGSAVMAGHEDNAIATPAIFYDLHQLELGDDIYVVDRGSKRLHFTVVDEEIYPYDKAPLKRIFNANDDRYLVLITCAGDWLESAKTNDKRLVVYAKLVR